MDNQPEKISGEASEASIPGGKRKIAWLKISIGTFTTIFLLIIFGAAVGSQVKSWRINDCNSGSESDCEALLEDFVDKDFDPNQITNEKFKPKFIKEVEEAKKADKNSKSPAGDKFVAAAQQIAFVECKKMSNKAEPRHEEQMLEIFKFYNIDRQVIDSPRTRELVDKFINDGYCELTADWDSIQQIGKDVLNTGKSQYSKLTAWQKSMANIMATAECKLKFGQFSAEGRESYVLTNLENMSWPVDVQEEDVEKFVKTSMPVIAWLAIQKTKEQDCSYSPR